MRGWRGRGGGGLQGQQDHIRQTLDPRRKQNGEKRRRMHKTKRENKGSAQKGRRKRETKEAEKKELEETAENAPKKHFNNAQNSLSTPQKYVKKK